MPVATPALTTRLPQPAAALPALLRRCLARQRQRRQLAELDDARLRDMGLDRVAALAEAAKPFWRA